MLKLFASLIFGLICGTITGLVPGIHVNLVSSTLLVLSPHLLKYFSVLELSAFIVSMSVTHTFLDTIPSTYLGAPDSDTALGVLPGHRMLLSGEGHNAIKLTIVGSLGGLLLSVFLFPAFYYFTLSTYEHLQKHMGMILIAIVCFMLLKANKKLWSLCVFLLSGILGVVLLNTNIIENPLFPLFSGLFGISTLMYSFSSRETIPKQKTNAMLKIRKGILSRSLITGQVSGFLTAMLPGLGASSAAVIGLQFNRKLGDKGFLILIGSISTVNFTLSLATLLAVNKARNGSVIAVQELIGTLSSTEAVTLILTALAAGSFAVILGLNISKGFSKLMKRVDYRKMVLSVIALITLLTFLLTGWIGILVLVTSTALGLLAPALKISRTSAMGCLLLPVIFYFIL